MPVSLTAGYSSSSGMPITIASGVNYIVPANTQVLFAIRVTMQSGGRITIQPAARLVQVIL